MFMFFILKSTWVCVDVYTVRHLKKKRVRKYGLLHFSPVVLTVGGLKA